MPLICVIENTSLAKKSQEETVEDESRKPGEEPQEEPANGASERGKTFEDRLKTINIVQQNAIIISGRRINGGGAGSDKPSSERWL